MVSYGGGKGYYEDKIWCILSTFTNELLSFRTTYAPKFVDVHTFSKKLKDVTEKTNIRQFSKIMLPSISLW